MNVLQHTRNEPNLCIKQNRPDRSYRDTLLIVFSIVYGFSDGVFIASQCFILLSCVDAKRTTASFCINNVLYSFTAAADGPIAGELGPIPLSYENKFLF